MSKTHDYTDQYWGHAVGLILDTKTSGVYSMMGHGFGIKDGDALTLKMNSGRIGKFEVSEVEYKSNPRDLWKLEAKFIGYTDEVTP